LEILFDANGRYLIERPINDLIIWLLTW